MSIALKNKWLYYLDEKHQVHGKVHASEFQVTDLKMIDKTTVASFSDGTIKFWNYNCRECCATWRAECNFADARNPLVFDVSDTKVVSGRAGVQHFDTVTQKLIHEWPAPTYVSALSLNPNNDSVVAIGLANGCINGIDLRTNEIIVRQNFGVKEPIFKISQNRNGAEFQYLSTLSGKVIEWNTTTQTFRPIQSPSIPDSSTLIQFDVHKSLPLIALETSIGCPYIISPQSNILYTMKNVPPGSVFAFHPILPLITVATPNCDTMTFDILLCP